ncbi:MAG: single-stranded DNA-binding protein, partial [Oscillospiraceae bacterium]|nr:single-stranded DNA-binding protein [Oscillospiraceae bacterium]
MNLNKVTLIGRLVRDPEPKETQSGTHVVSFSVACDRMKTKTNPEPGADFISCVAWQQSADFLAQYGHKGDTIVVEGRISTRNYDDKDGKKVYVTEVTANNVQLAPKQNRSESDEYLNNMGDFEENRAKNRNRDKLESSIGIEPD